MASLQNEQIDQSYQGLIKTANNLGGAPFPPVKLQYGDGQELPISIGDGTSVGIGDIVTIASGTRSIDLNSQNLGLNGLSSVDGAAGTVQYLNGTFTYGAAFPGAPATNVDFTNATVTGLPGGAAGLENGTGTDSLQSAASLTTVAADASGNDGIALGDGAKVVGNGGIAIGDTAGYITGANTKAVCVGRFSGFGNGVESVQIGDSATAKASQGICVGHNARIESTSSTEAIAIGHLAGGVSTSDYGSGFIAIGKSTKIDGTAGTVDVGASIAIGKDSRAANLNTISIGHGSIASGSKSIAIGEGSTSAGNDTTVVGTNITTVSNSLNSVLVGTDLTTGGTGSDGTVVIGHNNQTSDGRSVAIGYDVDIPQGQGQAMGNDITITGADRSTAIGSGITIDTVGSDKIGIGTTMSLTADRAIGLGRDVSVSGDRGIAIGQSTTSTAAGAVALGRNMTAAVADCTTVNMLQVANYANLNFADDTAAAAGGVALGQLYHNAGVVRVRIS